MRILRLIWIIGVYFVRFYFILTSKLGLRLWYRCYLKYTGLAPNNLYFCRTQWVYRHRNYMQELWITTTHRKPVCFETYTAILVSLMELNTASKDKYFGYAINSLGNICKKKLFTAWKKNLMQKKKTHC